MEVTFAFSLKTFEDFVANHPVTVDPLEKADVLVTVNHDEIEIIRAKLGNQTLIKRKAITSAGPIIAKRD